MGDKDITVHAGVAEGSGAAYAPTGQTEVEQEGTDEPVEAEEVEAEEEDTEA